MTNAILGALRTEMPQHDHSRLELLLADINQHYFNGNIQALIGWAVPLECTRIQPTATGASKLNAQAQQAFNHARVLLANNDPQAALPLLIQCADQGHREGHLLLNHLLIRLNDKRWQAYTKRYNLQYLESTTIHAACYYTGQRRIAIHPYLLERRAPANVLKYLVFESCNHQISMTLPASKQRLWADPAIRWLGKHGFPVQPCVGTDLLTP